METPPTTYNMPGVIKVSVPLRGLDMWKPSIKQLEGGLLTVSVPLRGLDMWKLFKVRLVPVVLMCFSPLAGIRYVETHAH